MPTENKDPIISVFADDPEMSEIVGLFVGELPQRLKRLEGAMKAADTEALRVIAHQMKGAGAGYGFDGISAAGESLEAAIVQDRPIDEIRFHCSALYDICRRACRHAA